MSRPEQPARMMLQEPQHDELGRLDILATAKCVRLRQCVQSVFCGAKYESVDFCGTLRFLWKGRLFSVGRPASSGPDDYHRALLRVYEAYSWLTKSGDDG